MYAPNLSVRPDDAFREFEPAIVCQHFLNFAHDKLPIPWVYEVWPRGGNANALGLNQHAGVPTLAPFGQTPTYGFPARLGLSVIVEDCKSALSNESTGVNGTLL